MLLALFVREEMRSRVPMMPLALFRSRSFSGVNALTLLLYAGLGGALFFLPFLLIQVHGFSATLAGAAFLPFTAIMVVLSRWAGGLLDRFGARLPLIVGPAITGVGFVLLAWPGAAHSYLTLLAPMIVLGIGMATTVAPLTTSVINAVPERQAGVASGINNAVASLASLLAIAIFGAVALGVHNNTLARQAATQTLSAQAREAITQARGKFAAELDHASGRRAQGRRDDRAAIVGNEHQPGDGTGGGARLRGGAVRRADHAPAEEAATGGGETGRLIKPE